jgi:hypothetical protein
LTNKFTIRLMYGKFTMSYDTRWRKELEEDEKVNKWG